MGSGVVVSDLVFVLFDFGKKFRDLADGLLPRTFKFDWTTISSKVDPIAETRNIDVDFHLKSETSVKIF